MDPGILICEIQSVVRRAPTRQATVVTIAFPVFDDLRHRLLEWLDEIEANNAPLILPCMADTLARLRKVKGSARHQRLAEFLEHTLVAVESGDPESARFILLTAMAAFGWPSQFIGPL